MERRTIYKNGNEEKHRRICDFTYQTVNPGH